MNEAGGTEKIDWTAVQGFYAEIRIDESMKLITDHFTPVLIAITCNRLEVVRYLLEEVRLSP